MKKSLIRSVFGGLFLITSITSTYAQGDPLTYKGVQLGASRAEVTEKLGAYQCTGTRCTFNRVDCQGSSRGITEKPIYDAYIQRGKDCNTSTSFGGALVLYGMISFTGERMGEVDLTVPTPQMPQLADSVEARYGKPTSANISPIKTRSGAEHPNWVKTWTVGADNLVLELRSGTIDEGRVLLVSRERLAQLEAGRKTRTEAGAKDF